LTANFTPNGLDASSYTAPAARSVSINVVKSAQTITFDALPNRQFGDPPFTLSAPSSSAPPLTFITVSGPPTISRNIVTLTGTGHVIVRASQAGNGNYKLATTVDQGFDVIPATITF